MEPKSIEPKFFSVRDTSTYLGIGLTMTYELLNGGQIKSTTMGRRRLVVADSVRTFAEGLIPNESA